MSERPSAFRSIFAWTGGYIGCATYLGILLGGAVGFGIGLTAAHFQAYKKQYDEERAMIEPFLASDPAFKDLRCSQRSNGGVSLSGMVRKHADLDRLREQIIRFVGERRALEIMSEGYVYAER